MQVSMARPSSVPETDPFNQARYGQVVPDDIVRATGCVAGIIDAKGEGPGFAAFAMETTALLKVLHDTQTRKKVVETVKRTGLVVKVAEKTWDQWDGDENRYTNVAINSAMLNAATDRPDLPLVGNASRFIKLKSGIHFSEEDYSSDEGGALRGGHFVFAVAGFRSYRENREVAQMIALTSAAISDSRTEYLRLIAAQVPTELAVGPG